MGLMGGIVVPTESLIARYELLGRLGRGGMAEVWLARAIGLRDFEKLIVEFNDDGKPAGSVCVVPTWVLDLITADDDAS